MLLSPSTFAASTVTLAWDSSTSTNIAGYKIYYGTSSHSYSGSVAVGTATTGTISNLVTGATYYFAATAYDSLNLESDFSNEVSYTNVLLAPPTIVLSSPGNNSSFAAPATISVAANVAANGHTITKVQFYNGASLLAEDTAFPYAYSWSNLVAGSYSLSAQVVYDAGSTVASGSANVTVTNLLAPTVALTSPANNATFGAPASIGLGANVAANGHSITKVQFYNGATLLGEDTTAPYTYSWNSVAIGIYSLSAKAVYDSGTTVSSGAANVMVTNTVPPAIALTSPANGSTFTAPVSIALAASVTTNGHFITKVEFYNGVKLIGEDTNAPYALTWSSVPAGTYSLTARLVYDAGATLDTTPAVNVVVAAPKPGNTPPAISSIADRSTSENVPTDPIPFTIQDAETASAALLLFATSGNEALLPTNNIVFGGADSSRTVVLLPSAGATGAVQVTVFVSDGTYTTNTSFTLTVAQGITPIRLFSSVLASNKTATLAASSTSYNGLFYEGDAVRLSSAGSFTISVNSRGKYSGRLQFGKSRYSFSGYVDAQGNATNSVNRKGGSSLTIDFHISGSQSEQLSGHLTDGTWTAMLAGDRAEFGKSSAAPFAGNYTLIIPGYETNSALPSGDSFGSLKVDSAGKIKFVGTLADGTKVSQSVPVARNGYWPLYAPLYSGSGSLMSWMTFAAKTNSDLSGQVIWLKQSGAKSKYYVGGFTADCQAFGSSYKAIDPVLNLPTATLTFYGGSLASEVTNSISIGAKSKVGTPGKQLKLTFSRSNGTFKGTYADPAGGKPLPFAGAVFQKLNAAYGVLFGTSDQTSEVRLLP